MATITFITSSASWTFSHPSGSGSVTMACWGAGGHGNSTGNGGSGGAYAVTTVSNLPTGSYFVNVGKATANGGGSSFVTSSAGVVLARAPGGNKDGTVTNQSALLTGSVVASVGGKGSPDFVGYSSYNGSGGGGAGGGDGQSAFYSTRDVGAAGGVSTVGGNGGVGAFYYAGSGVDQIMSASSGAFPGGGGGGSYDYGRNTSGNGGDGQVVITYAT